MLLSDLKYDYPEELVATSPSRPTRVMLVSVDGSPREITIKQLLDIIPAGDILILNDTQVLKRRIFARDIKDQSELEILFLDRLSNGYQKVLFPSKKYKIGDEIRLPNGAIMTLLEKGLPQTVRIDPPLTEKDFEEYGELPLPPYIQKARGKRHNHETDESWYQTAWAKNPGSYAAPTASLHFTHADLAVLKAKGVLVESITLHVGLGTFLPVKVEDLSHHKMHEEYYEVKSEVWDKMTQVKKKGGHVWALGTTVTRTLETVSRSEKEGSIQLVGSSRLLLQVGSEFQVVDRLMTNFHQPESTLLALVAAFSNLEIVKRNYKWAIDRKFKLFSYGDLSVWMK